VDCPWPTNAARVAIPFYGSSLFTPGHNPLFRFLPLSPATMASSASQNSNGQTHVTVLIEQKDFTPFGSLRRSSLTPSITTITAGGADSASSTTSNSEWRDSTGASIAANRRQRTSTTFHPSLDVPDSLVASLSSTAIGECAQFYSCFCIFAMRDMVC
jgi:hypothetical protein